MRKVFFFVVLIVILAAFFASANPDGLDFVAEKLGFVEKGIERSAPMTDYSVKFLPHGGVSTSLAGLAGILIILLIFNLAVYLLKKSKIFCSFIIILLAASPAFAARPLVTDDFGTVDSGKYEQEVGYNSITSQPSGIIQLKRGFTPNFDFGIEVPYLFSPPAGVGDAILHAKLKIFEIGENDGLTARMDMKLSNGDEVSGLGSGYNDYTAILIYSKAFGDFRTHYNVGYTLTGVSPGTPDANTFSYAAALEKQIINGLDAAAEYYGLSSIAGSCGNLHFGGRFQVIDTLRFDAGCSFALNENSSNVITTGLTAEF